MYRRAEVIAKLFGWVGFSRPTQAEYDIVDADNLASKSGRYFDRFHPTVTIQNIKDAANIDVDISNEDFNTKLKELQEDCIYTVLDGVFNSPAVIEQVLEFDTCDEPPVLIPNAGRFVGRQIRVASVKGQSVKINAITLYFNGPATFNMYLFNSLKKAPLKTLEVTAEEDNQAIIEPEDWILNYMDSGNKSGVFYVGYFQDDLGEVQAYDEQPPYWNCQKCFGTARMEANRIPAQADFVRFNPYLGTRTFGLNFEISTVADYTEKIVQNPAVFVRAIGMQMAAKVVEMVIHTTRSNLIQRIGEAGMQKLYNDLNIAFSSQEMPFKIGILGQLERELKSLRRTFFPDPKPVSNPIPDTSCCTPRYPR